MLVPAAIFVLAIQLIGIYVAAAIYIALLHVLARQIQRCEERARRRADQRRGCSSCSKSGSRCRSPRGSTARILGY